MAKPPYKTPQPTGFDYACGCLVYSDPQKRRAGILGAVVLASALVVVAVVAARRGNKPTNNSPNPQ